MNKDFIYFDHNATTMVYPEVVNAMVEVSKYPLNPSSIHSLGRSAKAYLEDSRNNIALHIGVDLPKDRSRLIFTSSGTEANNLIISHYAKKSKIFISAIEHPSIMELCNYHKNIEVIDVDSEGLLDLNDLEEKISKEQGRPFLVSIMYVNNETGVIQSIKNIAEIVHKYGGKIHSDIVQAFGKIPVNVKELELDFATISAHKIGGPQGVGALYLKQDMHIMPIIIGGGQERGGRSGTENVVAAVGFAESCKYLNKRLEQMAKVENLRNLLESKLRHICKDVIIFASNAPRVANTSMIYMPSVSTQMQVIQFDLAHIAVSSGSACSSGKVASSKVLYNMGVKSEIAASSIRVSLGVDNTEEQIDKFVQVWGDIYYKFQNKVA